MWNQLSGGVLACNRGSVNATLRVAITPPVNDSRTDSC